MTDLDEGPPPGADGASYRFGFEYWDGERTAQLLAVYMDRIKSVERIALVADHGSAECTGCRVSFDAERNQVTGVVPLSTLDAFIADQGGRPGGGELRNLTLLSEWVHVTDTPAGNRMSTAGAVADRAATNRTFQMPAR